MLWSSSMLHRGVQIWFWPWMLIALALSSCELEMLKNSVENTLILIIWLKYSILIIWLKYSKLVISLKYSILIISLKYSILVISLKYSILILSSFPPAIPTCQLHKQNSYQSSRELSWTYQQWAGVITKFSQYLNDNSCEDDKSK